MRKWHFSLSTNILIGLILGVLVGLFFGEMCSWLGFFGRAFIKLLQMTIVPYIVVSLVLGIGSLTSEQAKRLAVRGGGLLLLFWTLGIMVVLAISLALPAREGGSFFSANLVTPVQNIDYLDQYIPWNPFYSLANTIVPAVVVFAVFVGIALIGIKNKERLLGDLSLLMDALTRVTNAVVQLTPFGVFAITANTASTMTFDQFKELQVYFFLFIAATLLLTFLVLPVLATLLTPFKYRDIVNISKDALVTGFTTSNLFVVMPIVSMGLKKLFEKYELENEELSSSADIVVPIYFNLPDTGKLVLLFFIPFAAWFVGLPLALSQYPNFAVSGFLSFLGSANLAIPYLLSQFNLASDLFELFIASTVLTGMFATLTASMDLFVFALLASCALTNMIRFRWRRILLTGAGALVIFCIVILGSRIVLKKTIHASTAGLDKLENMDISSPVSAKVYKLGEQVPVREGGPGGSLWKSMRETGVLRVGYDLDHLPFAYLNGKGDLVGFDVAMAYALAEDLQCSLEFIPTPYRKMIPALNTGLVDIVMSGTSIPVEMLGYAEFSEPYMDATLALIVKDQHKEKFEKVKSLRKMENLTVAALEFSPFLATFTREVPNAKIVLIERALDFYTGKVKADVLLASAEGGAAWTMRYPAYGVVVPMPVIYKTSLAYPLQKDRLESVEILNPWIRLQKLNGFVDAQKDKWVMGKTKELEAPRWSIIRNVLHWVK